MNHPKSQPCSKKCHFTENKLFRNPHNAVALATESCN